MVTNTRNKRKKVLLPCEFNSFEVIQVFYFMAAHSFI